MDDCSSGREPSTKENNNPPRFFCANGKIANIREVFGSNTLVHRELRIDIFTAITGLFVLVKLLCVSGIGWFKIAGIFYGCRLGAVQALLMLLHLREVDELEMTSAFRAVQNLSADLESNSGRWMALFIALHLPLFGYPA